MKSFPEVQTFHLSSGAVQEIALCVGWQLFNFALKKKFI